MSHRKLPTVEEASQRYAHGTYARFCLGKCRCMPCKLAHSEYNRNRYQASHNPWRISKRDGKTVVYNKRTGETADPKDAQALLMAEYEPDEQLVATNEVRKHVVMLQKSGIGLKKIAKAAPVAYSVLQRIMNGEIRRTRRATAERILGVGRADLPDAANVDASESYKLLQRIRSAKYKRYAIADRLGMQNRNLRLWNRPGRWIRLANARKIHALYLELCATDTRLPTINPEFIIPTAQPSTSRGGMTDRTPWSEKEKEILRTLYPVMKAEEIAKRLPGRSVSAIRVYASKLGVRAARGAAKSAAA